MLQNLHPEFFRIGRAHVLGRIDAAKDGSAVYRFDIRLQGADETVFFAV